jgi:hypothetical protein
VCLFLYFIPSMLCRWSIFSSFHPSLNRRKILPRCTYFNALWGFLKVFTGSLKRVIKRTCW